MTGNPEPAPGDEPEIADAELLFRDTPTGSCPKPVPDADDRSTHGGYELEETDEPGPGPVVPPAPAAVPRAERAKPTRPERMTLEPSAAVEQVWSRWAEWGTTLTVVTAAALFLVLVLYFALGAEAYGLAVVLLFAGGLVLALLSYPLVITLERPVRITPEQAVRDFYAALSHHVPHYRRMWLLLSRAGRTSSAFASLDGFQAYWRGQLARLRGGKVSGTVPLKFQVIDFKSAKSAGLSATRASYTLEVYARGRTAAGPLAVFHANTSLVRGPDRMWYLDQGTLPEARGGDARAS